MADPTTTTVPATEGRIVHIAKRGVSHCIPAIVVRNFSGHAINVLLFPDGSNDGYAPVAQDPKHGAVYALPWMTSVPADDTDARLTNFEASWHWPERV
jgi:hypothetical protein